MIISITILLNFAPCFSNEKPESDLDMAIFRANEVVLGKTQDVKADINGDIYTIKTERILKNDKSPWQKIWAHCYARGQQCPSQEQNNIVFIIQSGQDNYFVAQVYPAEMEAKITALIKEQNRIMQEGSNAEAILQTFINSFCATLEKNDFAGFKSMATGLKIDERLADNETMLKIFDDLKVINKQYNYRNIYTKNFRQERYPIYKGIYTLGGHEYNYTYIHFERKDNAWVMSSITHCD